MRLDPEDGERPQPRKLQRSRRGPRRSGSVSLHHLHLGAVHAALVEFARATYPTQVDYVVEVVAAGVTHALRLAVLRPGRSLTEVALPMDDHEEALHVVARDDRETVVATGSIHPEDRSDGAAPGYRVRGMATEPGHRGQGLGKRILDRLVEHARHQGAVEVWCNARTGALSLYERAGFVHRSGVFEIGDIGPHVVMARELRAPRKL